jgi:hypothetical protein
MLLKTKDGAFRNVQNEPNFECAMRRVINKNSLSGDLAQLSHSEPERSEGEESRSGSFLYEPPRQRQIPGSALRKDDAYVLYIQRNRSDELASSFCSSWAALRLLMLGMTKKRA